MKKFFSLFSALLFAGSLWAATVTLTNANIVAAGDAASSYAAWAITDGASRTWNAYAIKNQHSKATSAYHFLQIKKYDGSTAYYIQVPDLGEAIQSITMTVSGSSQPMTGGSNTATLFFSASNSTSAEGTGVASGTGAASVTIDASALNLKSGYITAGGAVRIWDITITTGTPAVITPSISGVTPFYDATEVTLSCATAGADIYYTTDGSTPDNTKTKYTAAFNLTATTTVKAIAIKDANKSSVAEKTFTQAPAYSSIDALVAADLSNNSPVKVSFEEVQITGVLGNRKGIFVNVKDKNNNDVEIYYNNSNTVPAEWVIGGSVSGTINATWTLYSGQWEIVPVTDSWQWTSLTYNAPAVPAIIITSKSVDAPCAGLSGKINVTYNNIDDFSSAEIAFFEADGTTPATCDWVNTSFDSDHNVDYTIAANEEAEARKAYLKVKVGEVSSDLVTITQAQYVPEFATLPFAFDGGKAAIESTPGLTQSGLGSDYTASPKLKFDHTDDYLILKINETPGTLSFDIKGNPATGKDGIVGTFKVQTSADGETYTDLETYSNFTGKKSESFNNLASTVRYIKWIYSSRTSGNVALGNIGLSKASGTSLDNTASDTKAVKTIVNGQLIIEKAGVKYNVLGQSIR